MRLSVVYNFGGKKLMKRINLRMEEEKFLFLEKKAEKLNLSMNEYINKVLDDELLLEVKTKSRLKNDENYRNLFLPTIEDLEYVKRKKHEMNLDNLRRRRFEDELEL